MWIGDTNNVAQEADKLYIGNNVNSAVEIEAAWIGDENGKAQLIFKGGVDAGEVVFTESTTWTVPEGVSNIEIFAVGGGGGGGGGYRYWKTNGYWDCYYSSGGAGGYTNTIEAEVTAGDELTIVVGAGGTVGLYYERDGSDIEGTTTSTSGMTNGGAGGASTVLRGDSVLITANGGNGGYKNKNSAYVAGADGGSGSGCGGKDVYTSSSSVQVYTGKDGSDGSDGGQATIESTGALAGVAGKGQGTTTRAFGESNGTLYSTAGVPNPSANSGHGGRGHDSIGVPYSGASGIVIIRWAEQ